jgi:hypothetical protein
MHSIVARVFLFFFIFFGANFHHLGNPKKREGYDLSKGFSFFIKKIGLKLPYSEETKVEFAIFRSSYVFICCQYKARFEKKIFYFSL